MMARVESRYDELAEFDLSEGEIDAMMAAGTPVEVVGPPARFELFVDDAHRFGWRLSGADGQVLAASEVYPTKAAAVRAVEAVRRAGAAAALVDRTAS
jgi:uncharacterized protein YegP (UPF0339 family)